MYHAHAHTCALHTCKYPLNVYYHRPRNYHNNVYFYTPLNNNRYYGNEYTTRFRAVQWVPVQSTSAEMWHSNLRGCISTVYRKNKGESLFGRCLMWTLFCQLLCTWVSTLVCCIAYMCCMCVCICTMYRTSNIARKHSRIFGLWCFWNVQYKQCAEVV